MSTLTGTHQRRRGIHLPLSPLAAPAAIPVISFYVLAYLLTWLVWGTQVAQQHGWLSFHIKEWFGYWGVTIAAFLVAGLTLGRAGIRISWHDGFAGECDCYGTESPFSGQQRSPS